MRYVFYCDEYNQVNGADKNSLGIDNCNLENTNTIKSLFELLLSKSDSSATTNGKKKFEELTLKDVFPEYFPQDTSKNPPLSEIAKKALDNMAKDKSVKNISLEDIEKQYYNLGEMLVSGKISKEQYNCEVENLKALKDDIKNQRSIFKVTLDKLMLTDSWPNIH